MSHIDLIDICHGLWWTIHNFGKHCRTENDKLFYIEYLNRLSDQFPCSVCKMHFIEMLHDINDEMDTYWNMNHQGEHIGMFRLSWILHNRVNKRLNKPIVTWEEACRIYYPENYGISFKPCGQAI